MKFENYTNRMWHRCRRKGHELENNGFKKSLQKTPKETEKVKNQSEAGPKPELYRDINYDRVFRPLGNLNNFVLINVLYQKIN